MSEKGLSIVGINIIDDPAIAKAFLRDNKVTFANIVDSSEPMKRAIEREYQTLGMNAVPMTYVIDREGKVVDAWYGIGAAGDAKAEAALEKLGIK